MTGTNGRNGIQGDEQRRRDDAAAAAADAVNTPSDDTADRITVAVRGEGRAAVVNVRGEVDIQTVPVLKAALADAAVVSPTVIVNVSDVHYMDSSGFGALLGLTRQLRPLGGGIHLVGCSPNIMRMLQITRLNTIFLMHDTEEDALRSLSSDTAPSP